MVRSHGALGLCLALLSGLAALGAASPAHAQGAPTDAQVAEARHSFEVASTAFEQGDYETAAAEFRAAYELLRHPDLLFNVYLAEERAGRHAEALAAAGVLALSFGGLAIASEIEDQSLASSCGRDAGRWCSAERVSTLEALNVAADASWIGAAALGTLGVVLLFALPPERAPASARAVPWIGPDGAGIAAGARF